MTDAYAMTDILLDLEELENDISETKMTKQDIIDRVLHIYYSRACTIGPLRHRYDHVENGTISGTMDSEWNRS